jgi:hypothetical protein
MKVVPEVAIHVPPPKRLTEPYVWFAPVPPVSIPPLFISTANPAVYPLPKLAVLALQSNVPLIVVLFCTVKLALVVPSQAEKLPVMIFKLLATVRGNDLPAVYRTPPVPLFIVTL